MARFLGLLILLAVVGYGIWPYYSVFRIDSALEQPDAQALAPLVDLPAIQAHYKRRIGNSMGAFVPEGDSDADKVIGWLAGNLKQLGDAALDQAITLDWVRTTLINGIERAGGPGTSSFMSSIDFAFFESWNRFVVRLGKLGEAPTFLTLTLDDNQWRVTDLTR